MESVLTMEIKNTIQQALDFCEKKKIEQAGSVLKSEVERVEALNLRAADGKECYSFNTLMEMELFKSLRPDLAPVTSIEEPLNRLYAMYGSVLLELGKLDEAEEALAIAMDWTPVSADIAFEHAEVFKQKKDLETFKKLTAAIFSIAYKRRELAHCYRNIGYYFVEKQYYEEAVGSYLLSMSFADAEGRYQAEQELKYIYDETKGEAKRPSIGAMRLMAKNMASPLVRMLR